jgi:transcriptional regulator with XRE-family HTH domain
MGKTKASDPLKLFGENHKKIREAKGLSLRSQAALCRVDYSDIAKIEKGEKNITLLTVLELAKALEVHPKKLLDLPFDLED